MFLKDAALAERDDHYRKEALKIYNAVMNQLRSGEGLKIRLRSVASMLQALRLSNVYPPDITMSPYWSLHINHPFYLKKFEGDSKLPTQIALQLQSVQCFLALENSPEGELKYIEGTDLYKINLFIKKQYFRAGYALLEKTIDNVWKRTKVIEWLSRPEYIAQLIQDHRPISQTLFHEIYHMIDHARNNYFLYKVNAPSDEAIKEKMEKDIKEEREKEYAEELQKYYNAGPEFNARFQAALTKYLERMEMDSKYLQKVTTTFDDFFGNYLMSFYNIFEFDELSDKMRKHLIKRLFNIYQYLKSEKSA